MVEMSSIMEAAQPVVRFIPYLKDVTPDFPLESIQKKLRQSIEQFEDQAKLQGMPSMKVLTLRYVLCAVLDEAILQSSLSLEWSRCTLLTYFHQDSWGGEKVFSILDELKRQPAENVDALQLIYVCLTLGFKGKYALKEDGLDQLESLRRQLFHLIQPYQHVAATAAESVVPKFHGRTWPRFRWPWVIGIGVLAIGLCFGVSKYLLVKQSGQLVQQLNQVSATAASKEVAK